MRIGSIALNMSARDLFVAPFGEMDEVEIEIVVPLPIDAFGRVDQRCALLVGDEPDHAVVGGVAGYDSVDRLEYCSVELLDLARALID